MYLNLNRAYQNIYSSFKVGIILDISVESAGRSVVPK